MPMLLLTIQMHQKTIVRSRWDKSGNSMEHAFTLLELLVVLAILGILAATAVPQYSDYKKRAFDSRALFDLRNVATAEEAYFLDSETYLSCNNDQCSDLPGINAISEGVLLAVTASSTSFTGTSAHPNGTGKIFRWDSESGGLVE